MRSILRRIKRIESAVAPGDDYWERQDKFWAKVAEDKRNCRHEELKVAAWRPFIDRGSKPLTGITHAARGHCYGCGTQDFYWNTERLTGEEVMLLARHRFDGEELGDLLAGAFNAEGRLDFVPFGEQMAWHFGGNGKSFKEISDEYSVAAN